MTEAYGPYEVARVLRYVDNPANEDRWSDANAIADRLGWHRRGMTATLDALARRGLVEWVREDYVPVGHTASRLWRVVA
jgi:DNA-binding MarR family transcriptional regulator